MRRSVIIVGAAGTLVIAGLIIQQLMQPGLDTPAGIDAAMQDMVGKLNAQLPRALGQGISLQHASYANQTVVYDYTMDAATAADAQKRSIINNNVAVYACTQQQPILSRGVSIVYRSSYSENNKPQTLETRIVAAACAALNGPKPAG